MMEFHTPFLRDNWLEGACDGRMWFSLKERGGEEYCKEEIESHNECLRKNGLSVVATSPV